MKLTRPQQIAVDKLSRPGNEGNVDRLIGLLEGKSAHYGHTFRWRLRHMLLTRSGRGGLDELTPTGEAVARHFQALRLAVGVRS